MFCLPNINIVLPKAVLKMNVALCSPRFDLMTYFEPLQALWAPKFESKHSFRKNKVSNIWFPGMSTIRVFIRESIVSPATLSQLWHENKGLILVILESGRVIWLQKFFLTLFDWKVVVDFILLLSSDFVLLVSSLRN